MLETYSARLAAPFAVLGIRTAGERLTGIDYLPLGAATLDALDDFAREVCRQVEAYLEDPAFRLDLPYRSEGSQYQQRVWDAVKRIPRGETKSYCADRGADRIRATPGWRRMRRQPHSATHPLSSRGCLSQYRRIHA